MEPGLRYGEILGLRRLIRSFSGKMHEKGVLRPGTPFRILCDADASGGIFSEHAAEDRADVFRMITEVEQLL